MSLQYESIKRKFDLITNAVLAKPADEVSEYVSGLIDFYDRKIFGGLSVDKEVLYDFWVKVSGGTGFSFESTNLDCLVNGDHCGVNALIFIIGLDGKLDPLLAKKVYDLKVRVLNNNYSHP